MQAVPDGLLDDLSCAVALLRPDAGIAWANATFWGWTGADAEAAAPFPAYLSVASRMLFETHLRPALMLGDEVEAVLCKMADPDGGARSVLLDAAPSRSRPGLTLVTIFDASERALYEAKLKRSRAEAAQLAAVVTSSPDAILTVDGAGRVLSANQAADAMLSGLEGPGPADVRAVCPVEEGWFDAALPALGRGDVVRRSDALPGPPRDVELTLAPMAREAEGLGGDAGTARYSVVVRDVTEQRRAERQLRLVVAELNHRVKNSLAIVASVASFSMKNIGRDHPDVRAFQSRLQAMAAAHDMLTERGWEDAELGGLVRRAVGIVADMEQVEASGPEVALPARDAVTLSMAFHELATNAVKYGALSVPEGHVRVTWTYEARDGEPRIAIEWAESGGPTVTPPTQTGFGKLLIEGAISSALNGRAETGYPPEGVVCRVSFPERRVHAAS